MGKRFKSIRKKHDLKLLSKYYSAVVSGAKKFEARYNDRDYKVGDILLLREFDGLQYTGRKTYVKVTYVLHGGAYGIAEGYVILSITNLKNQRAVCLKRQRKKYEKGIFK